MATLPRRPPYVCWNCLYRTLSRPQSPPSAWNTLQWRAYASATEGYGPRLTKHLAYDSKQRQEQRIRFTFAPPTEDSKDTASQSPSMAAPRSSTPRRRLRARRVQTEDNRQSPTFSRSTGHSYSSLRRLAPQRKRPILYQSVGIRRHLSYGRAPRYIGGTKISIIHGETNSLRGNDISNNGLVSSATTHIWAPSRPVTNATLHFSALEDFNWYWETLPPTIAQKTQANHFFSKNAHAKFLRSEGFFRAFPESDVPEVAFVGRSNVGKSSLLNGIVNADVKALLARTSSTPGFTKTMNLYGIGPGHGVNITKMPSGHDKIVGPGGLTIVDMPGYGEGSLSEWGVEIMKYLQSRKQLRRVFVLIDAQHGLKDKDRSLLASLRLGGISHQIILSKVDKLFIPKSKDIRTYDGKRLAKLKPRGSLKELRESMEKIRGEIQPPFGGSALGEILACSSEILVDGKRLGIDHVRFAVLQAAGFAFRGEAERGKRVREQLARTVKTN
ncbi:hypothetical protein BU26DRAFT_523418 [Trematosphaeria pertusa]|uniref:EngB-type G domain-containing protein n=1 Tax=Trematosphaeria pertusa TaxID=390896 RepID=A0A6A6I1V2_9PLEO|nr:uncharacterized protein BU26DRAFT_523418 [Trematosphaeria pertusa]KAF2243843.1 hypothetical protein BU26DRAFT_523418 [Trematosphaeria pertusa]